MSKAFNSNEMAKFWTHEAPTYESQRHGKAAYPMQEIRLSYILDLLGDEPKKHLDVGCGPGYMLIPLIKKGWDVTGTDISDEMLERARKNIEEAGCDVSKAPLSKGNIEDLKFEDNSFDSIVCEGVVEYLKDDTKALSELQRVLKPGGVLVITIRNRLCLFRLWDALKPARSAIKAGLARIGLCGGKAYLDKPFRDGIWFKKHTPFAFNRSLKRHGFSREDQRYFHYYVLPAPLEYALGRVGTRLAVSMERLAKNSISAFLASGCILKATKCMATDRG